MHEIEVPTATTRIHTLACTNVLAVSAQEINANALAKIDTLEPVTEPSKALGADFRRDKVRASWQAFRDTFPDASFQIATFTCICSAGTYMRSLAEHIGNKLNVPALAYSIHRDRIGQYRPLPLGFGVWTRTYRN